MTITSNLLIDTKVGKADVTPFNDVLGALREIDRLIQTISGHKVLVDVTLVGNATQQVKNIQQQINQAVGATSAGVGGISGIKLPINFDVNTSKISQVTTSIAGLKDTTSDVAKNAIAAQLAVDKLGTSLGKSTVQTKTLQGQLEIVQTTSAKRAKGDEGKVEVSQLTKIRDLAQEIAISEAKAAQARERRANIANASAQKSISDLQGQGFIRSIDEGSQTLLVFKQNIGGVLDRIASVNTETGKTSFKIRENADLIKEAEAAQLRQAQATLATANNAKLLNNGFKQVNTTIKETASGAQKILEFQRIRATPADLFKGTPAVDIAKVNTVTGELTATTLEGAKAARLIGDNFLSAAGKVLVWTASTSAIFGAIRLIKEAVSETISLEQGTVLLARVGKGFADSAEGQIEAAKSLTTELVNLSAFYGVSASEAQQAAAIFARSGLSVNQTAEATKAALLASQVAEISAVDAARLFSSELSQFKLSADQLLPSLDRLNTLSNNYRVTTNDLLQSISRAGSVFAEQGRSETELAAITAILSQTTARTGAEIGTALKTIVSNLERVDVVNKLVEKTGVAFSDAEGPTGSFNRTLAVLSLQLDKLNKIERNNITISAAGVRQRNIFEAALRGSTDALLAEVKAFSEQSSANNEFRLQANTLGAAIERLAATFTKLVNTSNVAETFASFVNTLTAILDTVNLLGPALLKTIGLLTVFVGLKAGIAAINIAFSGMATQVGALAVSELAATGSTNALSTSMIGLAAASQAAEGAIAVSAATLGAIAGIIVLTANFVSAFTAALRDNTIQQDKNRESKLQATQNALSAAKAEQELTQQFTDQVKALKEVEDQLAFIDSARARQRGQAVPNRNEFPQEAGLRARREALLEGTSRISSGLGLSSKNIQDAAEAQRVLNQLQQESAERIAREISDAERARAGLEADLRIENSKLKVLELQKDEHQGFENELERQLRVQKEQETSVERFLDRLKEGIPFIRNMKGPLEENKEAIDEFNKKFQESKEQAEKTTKSIQGITDKLAELKKANDQLALAQKTLQAIQRFRELKVEIETVAEATRRISDISESLGIDKAKGKQLELNRLREIELELIQQHNTFLDSKQPERAKDVEKEIKGIQKQKIDLDTELARTQIERLSKYITDTLNSAFNAQTNITRRSTIAKRRFLELGEELDTLHELGASAKLTENAMNNMFSQAIRDSITLEDRMRKLTIAQDKAASASLKRSLKDSAIAIPLNFAGLSSANERKALEALVKNKIKTDPERELALQQARRAATEKGPDETDIFLITKTQVERQEAAKRLNELADIQLKIAEELIAKQAEITAEMRQQTKEQIKQLGLLSEEDKLHVLAQAAFFAANPDAKISATQQFLAPAGVNRIGQEFFAPHLAKEFDVEKEPLGRLLNQAGFGNERTRQLRESQAEILKRRDEFAGTEGKPASNATDAQILQKAISTAEQFRAKALELQDTMLKEFSQKISDSVEKIIPGSSGGSFKDGKLQLELTFTPKVDVIGEVLLSVVDKAIDAGFLKIRNKLIEFTRESIKLDTEKTGREPNKILPPVVPLPQSVPLPPAVRGEQGASLLPGNKLDSVSGLAGIPLAGVPFAGVGGPPEGPIWQLHPEHKPDPNQRAGLLYQFKDNKGNLQKIGAMPEEEFPGEFGVRLRVAHPDPAIEKSSGMVMENITQKYWGEGLMEQQQGLFGKTIIAPRPHLHPDLRGLGIGAKLYPIGFHAWSELRNVPSKDLRMWDSITSPSARAAIKSAVRQHYIRSKTITRELYPDQVDPTTLLRSQGPGGRRFAESAYQGPLPPDLFHPKIPGAPERIYPGRAAGAVAPQADILNFPIEVLQSAYERIAYEHGVDSDAAKEILQFIQRVSDQKNAIEIPKVPFAPKEPVLSPWDTEAKRIRDSYKGGGDTGVGAAETRPEVIAGSTARSLSAEEAANLQRLHAQAEAVTQYGSLKDLPEEVIREMYRRTMYEENAAGQTTTLSRPEFNVREAELFDAYKNLPDSVLADKPLTGTKTPVEIELEKLIANEERKFTAQIGPSTTEVEIAEHEKKLNPLKRRLKEAQLNREGGGPTGVGAAETRPEVIAGSTARSTGADRSLKDLPDDVIRNMYDEMLKKPSMHDARSKELEDAYAKVLDRKLTADKAASPVAGVSAFNEGTLKSTIATVEKNIALKQSRPDIFAKEEVKALQAELERLNESLSKVQSGHTLGGGARGVNAAVTPEAVKLGSIVDSLHTPTTTKIVSGLKVVGKNLNVANDAAMGARVGHAALSNPEHFLEWIRDEIQGTAEGIADLSHNIGDYSDSSSRQVTGKDSSLNVFRKVGDLFDFFAGRKFRGGGGESKEPQYAVPPENVGSRPRFEPRANFSGTGRFEPRMNFGAGDDKLLRGNNLGLSTGRGGILQAFFDDIGVGESPSGIGGPAAAGRALRGPAAAGRALRSPAPFGRALRAPSPAVVYESIFARRTREANEELQGRLTRMQAGETVNPHQLTPQEIELQQRRINLALGLAANPGDQAQLTISQNPFSISNVPDPNSPYGRVQTAIKQQRQLEQQRRKAEYEEAKVQRRNAYQNRGEAFVQRELARRGIPGGGAIGSDAPPLAPGQIPGVPANIGDAPGFLPNEPMKVPEEHEFRPWKFKDDDQGIQPSHGRPGNYGTEGILNAPTNTLGSVVHPQIDLGPFFADFEVRFSQVLVNAFTRAAPILADKIQAAMDDLPAKQAKMRPLP